MTRSETKPPSVDALVLAREFVDEVHRTDPSRDSRGEAAELIYADRMERWVARLVPDASDLLRLAARCQHLERWSVARDSFPLDRAGYNAWRRTLYTRQAERARELLMKAGVTEEDSADVATWVSKRGLHRNPGTQALEDAACLVFLENEIQGFASKHADYSKEKYLTILRRIWLKMSPHAREQALRIEMVPELAAMLQEVSAGE
jgi:hypothetical protein